MKNIIFTLLALASITANSATFKKCQIKLTIEEQKKPIFSKNWKIKDIKVFNPCWIGTTDFILRDTSNQPSSTTCGTNMVNSKGDELSITINNQLNSEGHYEYSVILSDSSFGHDIGSRNTEVIDEGILNSDLSLHGSFDTEFILSNSKRERTVVSNVNLSCN